MSKIEKKASGIMVALYLPQHIAQQIMQDDGEPVEDLHVTLCYLPGIGGDREAFQKIANAIVSVTEEFAPVVGRIGGIGRFNASENSDGMDVYYASYNSPVLPVIQKMIVDAIESNSGLVVSRAHGFTPHITLKYIAPTDPTPVERKATEEFKMGKITIASREYQMDLPFSGSRVLKISPVGSDVHVPVPMGEEMKKNYECDIFKDGGLVTMQRLVEGIDYETVKNSLAEDEAKLAAIENLNKDPNHYRQLFAEMAGKDLGVLKQDGLKIDLGCGQCREPGFIGFDIYPHDAGTVVHDLSLGIPVPDDSAETMRLVNSLSYMEGVDKSALLDEICRALKVDGQLIYEGPERLVEYPSQLELINESDNKDNLDKSSKTAWFKQVFKRVVPDPATAQDSSPVLTPNSIIGNIVTDANGHVIYSTTNTTAANQAYGYPSQGAADTLETSAPDIEKGEVSKQLDVPIKKADKEKQIVYGVVLTPDEVDSQDDYMTAEDIESAAHHFLIQSRVVGSQHEKAVGAQVVESYIAPQDMEWTGQYGPQTVKKGAWILGVKITDKKEWEKVLNGEYQAFSVGGFGLRE